MTKLKKIILICILIFVVVLIVLLISINNSKRNINSDYWTENESTEKYNVNVLVKENTSKYDFFAVKDCMETYYSYIKGMNTTLQDIMSNVKGNNEENYDYQKEVEKRKKESKEAVYACLGKEFLDEWNVTTNNIEQKIKIHKNAYVSIEKLYRVDSSDNVSIYFAYGNIIDTDTSKVNPFGVMLLMDMTKSTFKIYPTEYVEKHYNDISNGVKIELKVEEIENKEFNTFDYKIITEAQLISYYIQEYNNSVKYNKKRAYDLIDEEYREKRFGSYENFSEYLNENKKTNPIVVNKYSAQTKDGVTKYICVDSNGNYYIVNETTPTKFGIILDTYTIDLPEFTTKYNEADNQGKCALNIQKFMQAINEKDYNYAYNCLSQGFKNNYFKNVNQFKEYIKNNFYDTNKYEFTTFEEQSGLYTYKVKISNAENEEESITKTFVVKLNEGTKFELSFNKD